MKKNVSEYLIEQKLEYPNDVFEVQKLSDGYHTFEELYFHRMYLFSIICNQNKQNSFKSRLHYDGTMYENYFIVWINTPKGEYSYHYHMDYWGMFDVKELDKAPPYDGHKPSDLDRLTFLVGGE